MQCEQVWINVSAKCINVNAINSDILCKQKMCILCTVCILQYPKPSMCVYEAYVRERDGERGGLEFTFDHRAVVMPLAF